MKAALLAVALSLTPLAACRCESGLPPDGGAFQGIDAGRAASSFRLQVLSGRPDMVTGGDALIALVPEEGGPLDDITLELEGEDISAQLTDDDAGRTLALLEGLAVGENMLVATRGAGDEKERASLTLVNYPITGPVFSGPHEAPFHCNTTASFLGAPLDDDCSATTLVVYFSGAPDGTLKPLADPAAPPADIVMTTTSDGVTLPFIVRVEVGTINRAIYWIAALHDPAATTWQPVEPPAHWNEKAIYLFGGGCGTGYVQGDPGYGLIGSVAAVLGQGFAVMHSSLNTFGNNCNDVLSAETTMMVKERFIERYGVPRYTMGWGGSGGSMQQHLIAENYPGLLDGLVPSISYPDIWSLLPDVVDCRLLFDAFAAAPELWPDDEGKRAVTGYGSLATCTAWNSFFADLLVPSAGCPPGVPAAAVYDADDNPDGARCTLHDHNVNLLGVDEDTGFARRPYDNIGVQYGLFALESGAIDVEQFLSLNETIGGYDVDGVVVAERSAASAEAVRAAYAGGRVLHGERLEAVPIIDVRTWVDESGDIHDSFRTGSTRDRLIAANGHADNHVAFIAAPGAPAGQATLDAFVQMDAWLLALADDDDPDRASATRRTKPEGLGDRCYATAVPDDGACPETFPRYQSPRRTAGAPLANDVLQCALKPVDSSDYGVAFTDEQLTRLEQTFEHGVCDYSAPPPNRVEHAGAWQRY